MAKDQFVSGLPDKHPPRPRTLDDALRDALDAPRKKKFNRLRRKFSSPSTPETRRITARMLGEKEDE
ncbi:MAG TPA: hypothetical protein VD928_03425 [Candidatus Paceibacterota bacterium]|nr:hypothetical protein [Candidatus Paceibacterota bacterium]